MKKPTQVFSSVRADSLKAGDKLKRCGAVVTVQDVKTTSEGLLRVTVCGRGMNTFDHHSPCDLVAVKQPC